MNLDKMREEAGALRPFPYRGLPQVAVDAATIIALVDCAKALRAMPCAHTASSKPPTFYGCPRCAALNALDRTEEQP